MKCNEKNLIQLSSFIDNYLNNIASSVVFLLERMQLLVPKMGSVLHIRRQENTPGISCMQ